LPAESLPTEAFSWERAEYVLIRNSDPSGAPERLNRWPKTSASLEFVELSQTTTNPDETGAIAAFH
jgi:hypothetical protein